VGLADKKPRPTKDISPKLFAGGTPIVATPQAKSTPAKKNLDLTGSDSGLVRSSDVFNGGQALGSGTTSPPIVDWDAMAAHAQNFNRSRTVEQMFSETFDRNGRYYLFTRPVLIMLASVIVGCVSVAIFAHYTDRIAYQQYSEKGYELLHQTDTRSAVEYFLSQSNRTELESGSGSPYHIASLEGLAQSYANDKCIVSADDTFKRVINLLRAAPYRDDVRLGSALEHYADFLGRHERKWEAGMLRQEVKDLQAHNMGGHWLWFFGLLTFAMEALYMVGVLLADKKRIENWPIYAGFIFLGMLGMAMGMFKLGAPIIGALFGSLLISYIFMPFILAFACFIGKSLPAYHVLLPTRKEK